MSNRIFNSKSDLLEQRIVNIDKNPHWTPKLSIVRQKTIFIEKNGFYTKTMELMAIKGGEQSCLELTILFIRKMRKASFPSEWPSRHFPTHFYGHG